MSVELTAELTAEQVVTRDTWRAHLADEAIAHKARRRVTDIIVKRYHHPQGSLYPRACSHCKQPKAWVDFNIARKDRRRANCSDCANAYQR
jgi:hypothetical protein